MPLFLRMFRMLSVISLVTAAVASAAGVYVDNQDGTITDSKRAIVWQKGDDGVERSWKEAIKYCDALELAGHKDWTLPKAYQLEGLIDTAFSPAIDPVFAVKGSYYWSATDSPNSENSAKYVNFFYGNSYTYSKDNPYYVLCLREAAPAAATGLAAVFTGTPTTAGKPLSIRFKATISGGSEPYFFEWDFGDGGTSSASEPSHVFAKDGAYKVILTVSDNEGAIVVVNREITLPLAEVAAVEPGPGQAEKAPPGSAAAVPVLSESIPKATAPPAKGADDKLPAVSPSASTPPAMTGKGGTGEGLQAKPALPAASTAPHGVMAVSASGQGMPYKDGALGHGLLAYAFANALAGEGDTDKDGRVMASEMQSYLEQAIKGLSKGQQSPALARDGDDFAVCASPGSTYVLAIGISHDLSGALLTAGQDAEFVRKAVEDRCKMTKTMMLTAEHANREDILLALAQIGSMITPSDTLLVYVGAASAEVNGRTNWYVNDSRQELASFTGIYQDDLLHFLKSMPVGHVMVLGEKN